MPWLFEMLKSPESNVERTGAAHGLSEAGMRPHCGGLLEFHVEKKALSCYLRAVHQCAHSQHTGPHGQGSRTCCRASWLKHHGPAVSLGSVMARDAKVYTLHGIITGCCPTFCSMPATRTPANMSCCWMSGRFAHVVVFDEAMQHLSCACWQDAEPLAREGAPAEVYTFGSCV